MKIDEQLLKKMALEYLEGNISINDLAHNNHISKSSLIQYFNGKRIIKLPRYLQEQIDQMKQKKFIESKSTYGNQDKTILTKELIIRCAHIYISGDYTFEEIVRSLKEKGINVSIGTLSNYFTLDNLGEELYKQVREKIDYNKEHATDGIKK